MVTWTPTAAQTGAHAVTIEARDGKGGVTPQSFSVTVSATPPTNAAPVVTSTPGTTATVGAAYSYPAAATDADSDAVTFVLTSGPPGFAIAPSGVVTWTPTAPQTGAQAVTIEARDGKGGVTPQSFTRDGERDAADQRAPVFTSTPGTTATVGAAYSVHGGGDGRGQRRGDVRPGRAGRPASPSRPAAW